MHADETSVQVLNEDGKSAGSKSYMWLYRTSKYAKNHALIFEYQPNRNGENLENFLQNFKGYLHSDGYEGYHSLKNVISIGCWAHVRRKFNDCVKTLSNELKNSVPAAIGLNFCSKIFHLDKSFEELDFKERFKQRNLYLKPLVKSFFEWVKSEFSKNKLPNSNFGKALTYAINQEQYLMNVFQDGRLELSNNLAENAIRPFVIGRKNWLFCNTPKGAKASAVTYSIIETAKINGLKPLAYLKFLFETLPNLESENLIEKCLPWSRSLPEYCFLKVKS